MSSRGYIIAFFALFCAVFAVPVFAKLEVNIWDYYHTDQAGAINKLSKQINKKENEINDLNSLSKRYANEIHAKQKEIVTYKSHIEELEDVITKTEVDIKNINTQEEKVELEIEEKNLMIEQKENDISSEKVKIAAFIRKIDEFDRQGYFKILLLNDSLSEFFNQSRYLKDMEIDVALSLEKLKVVKAEIELDQGVLEKKNEELKVLELEAKSQKIQLESKVEIKNSLITETERSEEKYRQLMENVKAEKRRLEQAVFTIEADIQKKLAEKKLVFSWDPNNIQFIWPIPNQGITSYFHDPTYPARRIIGEHTGLDLRTLKNGRPSNGLPVRAAGPAYVAKVILGGKYVGNAVYLVHSKDLMTVYYHLNKVYVKEDEEVKAGDIVALSGGMPGTAGAGFSSGPHLHFEVRKNGNAVNPLNYLP